MSLGLKEPPRREFREIAREERVMKDKILAILADGGKTIPEIAEALGHPGHEVVYWVMTMRRYGLVEEEGPANDDGYFVYAATGKTL